MQSCLGFIAETPLPFIHQHKLWYLPEDSQRRNLPVCFPFPRQLVHFVTTASFVPQTHQGNLLTDHSKIQPWYPKLLFQRENALASFLVTHQDPPAGNDKT
jgi:hypothetical protein